jgi:two-component system response regulator AtoC
VENSSKIVLLVDDEEKFLEAIGQRLKLMGLTALKASSGQESVGLAQKNNVDLAIVDLNMPDMDGLVTIGKLRDIQPGIRTVLLTGYGNEKVKQAAEALHSNYFEKDNMKSFWDYVKRISNDMEAVLRPPPPLSGKSLRRPIRRRDNLGADEIELPQPLNLPNPLESQTTGFEYYHHDRLRLVGETPEMQELKRNITRAAVMDSPVLICGEMGTGKELVARAIHSRSRRKRFDFMAVNCSSFSRSLPAREIWGHEYVSSTGEVVIKAGLVETNPGGTILLDDIENMPLKMQGRLLRLLREKVVVRLGGKEEVPSDIRVMVAATGDLRKKIQEGKIREDLYHRLNIFELNIPPLRERRDDIAPLCSYLLNKLGREYGKEVKYISDEAMSVLMSYSFPGNVGELESLIERAVILADDEKMERKHLPERFHMVDHAIPQESPNFMTLAELEEQYILKVLEATRGNKTKAVEVLGISRGALWRKLKRFKEKKQMGN